MSQGIQEPAASLPKEKMNKKTEAETKNKQGGDSAQNRRQSRSKSGSRLCYNCDKMGDHWASNCPKPRKAGASDERRSHTPYPRPRGNTPTGEKGEANQGATTFRMIRGTWGISPLELRKLDKNAKSEMEKKEKPKSQKEKEKEQKEMDEVVEQLATFEIKQGEKEGDEKGHQTIG